MRFQTGIQEREANNLRYAQQGEKQRLAQKVKYNQTPVEERREARREKYEIHGHKHKAAEKSKEEKKTKAEEGVGRWTDTPLTAGGGRPRGGPRIGEAELRHMVEPAWRGIARHIAVCVPLPVGWAAPVGTPHAWCIVGVVMCPPALPHTPNGDHSQGWVLVLPPAQLM